jgi:anti-sigma-K factor RskA
MRLVWSLLVVAGCAHDVAAKFPSAPDDSTNTVVLLLTDAAEGVTVTVNGRLVVEDAHTKRVVIEHVPVGTAEIVVAANGTDKAFKVWVAGDHETTVPLGVGEAGSGGFLKAVILSVISIVAYSLLH